MNIISERKEINEENLTVFQAFSLWWFGAHHAARGVSTWNHMEQGYLTEPETEIRIYEADHLVTEC